MNFKYKISIKLIHLLQSITMINTLSKKLSFKNINQNEIKDMEACALSCKNYLNGLINSKNIEEKNSVDLLIVDYFSKENTDDIFESLQNVIEIASKDHYKKSKKIIRNLGN